MNIVLSSNLITFPHSDDRGFRVSLLPLLIEAVAQSSLGTKSASIRTAQVMEMFRGLPADLDRKIAVLHSRYTANPQYARVVDELERIAVIASDDDKAFRSHYRKLVQTMCLAEWDGNLFDYGRMAWSDVTMWLLQVVRSIQSGKLVGQDPSRVQLAIAKFEAYDDRIASLKDFVLSYFYGGLNSMFFNQFKKLAPVSKDPNNKSKLCYTPRERSFSTMRDKSSDGEDYDANLKGNVLNPIQDEFGFGLDEVQHFITIWNGKSRQDRIDLVYEAIQGSNEISKSMKSQINPHILAGALDKITNAIDGVTRAMLQMARSTSATSKQDYQTQIFELLNGDFIFRETINQFRSEEAPGQSPGIEGPTSDKEPFDYKGYNRSMLHDIVNKNYPVFQQQNALYHNPFGVRGVLNSSELQEALKDPSLIVQSVAHANALQVYFLVMAMLHTDYAYVYVSGRKGGSKSKSDSFESSVQRDFVQESTSVLGGLLDDSAVREFIAGGMQLYNEVPSDKMRRYRLFIHLLHRDLATTQAIYGAGLEWGRLTDEDIDKVASEVVSKLYPVLAETNTRRQFKVVNDKNAIEKQRSTVVLEQMDLQALENLVKIEVYKKNRAVADVVNLEQMQGNQVDTSKIVSEMAMKLSDVSAKHSEHSMSPMASKKTQRCAIGQAHIRLSPGPKDDVDRVFQQWAIRTQLG